MDERERERSQSEVNTLNESKQAKKGQKQKNACLDGTQLFSLLDLADHIKLRLDVIEQVKCK